MIRFLLLFLLVALLLYIIVRLWPPGDGNWRDDDDDEPPEGPRDPGKRLDRPHDKSRPDRVRGPADTDV